jgi:hypothetical protein
MQNVLQEETGDFRNEDDDNKKAKWTLCPHQQQIAHATSGLICIWPRDPGRADGCMLKPH